MAAKEPIPESLHRWLGLLDLAVNPHMLRSRLQEEETSAAALQALVRFLVSRPAHSQTDRDKVDWLLTHFFQKREEKSKRPVGWVRLDLERMLAGLEFPALSGDVESLLNEVAALLDEVRYFESFGQITDSRIIQRGRDIKSQFGESFFHPEVLAALVNYNLLFGKRFHALLQQTMQKVQAFAHQTGDHPPDTADLLRSEYRSTTEAFQRLGSIGREKPEEAERKRAATGTVSAGRHPIPALDPSAGGATVGAQLKDLGIDPQPQEARVNNRRHELAMRLRSAPNILSIPMPLATLTFNEWEATAFRTEYAEREQTFRAEFAASVCRAIAIISLIYEELPLYLEKKGSEYLWKKHYDALVYLLYEGRQHKEALVHLSASSHRKGLIEKSRQLLITADKLESNLARVASAF